MANSFPLPLDTSAESIETTHPRLALPLTLAAIDLARPAVVVALEIEDEMRAWLRAVGIREGERVTVLRRAVFGGPIHVRTSSGGEFALNRQLAKAIVLRASSESDASEAEADDDDDDDDEESAA